MRAVFKIRDPDKVEATITLTTTLGEWKALRSQLGGGWPAWKLAEAIGEAVTHAERHFYGTAHDPEPEAAE